ncbi:Lipase (class 3)-like protein [Elsinoe fawcettii]|nr:Lipase (class 3)-like protein [Elsinoe fawcettii]
MRFLAIILLSAFAAAHQVPLTYPTSSNSNVSQTLFNDIEELSRIVDISYCVGTAGTGISKPFSCLSRCTGFPSFELITTWNTGPLLSDSCGYLALSHAPAKKRVIVAFRGTYSLANTVLDLATVRQEYVPYPGSSDADDQKCDGCTAHMGFVRAWELTKTIVMPHLNALRATYPDYELLLVGHSLGGAVAAFAALDFENRGWKPSVTTFGEPRVGNDKLAAYFDSRFGLQPEQCGGPSEEAARYRRVTHIDDPVPLLPLSEWGYAPHAGEIFITKSDLSPEAQDLRHCCGNADKDCIAGQDESLAAVLQDPVDGEAGVSLAESIKAMAHQNRMGFGFPSRYKLWQLLFAHRDYFWRLGLCVPELHPEL